MEKKNQIITLSDHELRKLQLNLLEMLIEIDRICRKYGVKYSIDGGTLLGAVRHKGFIPWDDDIDVIMRRKEYERFQKACKKDLDTTRFFLQDYTTDPYYRWGYEKIRRKGTEQVRIGQEHLKQKTGLCIDIFVVDNVPDNVILRRPHLFACYVIRKLLYSEVGMKSAESGFMRGWYSFWYHAVPRDTVFHWRNCIAEKCNAKKTRLIRHMTYPYSRARYGLPAVCFDKMQDMEFEGYTFRAFQDYDRYLSALYGDYRKLPPKEQRTGHMEASKLKMLEPEDLFSKEELKRLNYCCQES